MGVGEVLPQTDVVEMADRIMRAANNFTMGPHITVDDEDGSLDLHLRLGNGLLVMANIFPDGSIDASVYDDQRGPPVKVVKRMRRKTTGEQDLVDLFRATAHDLAT